MMQPRLHQLTLILVLLCASQTPATVLYVDLNNTNPLPPYTNWIMAATNIQLAIDAANAGDLVLVTNGVYATGGRVVGGALTNRVALTKPLTVQSVNGPVLTTIQGYQVPGSATGPAAVRCAYLTNSAMLVGFTLTNGATLAGGELIEVHGGGIWCESTAAVVSNCVVAGNTVHGSGGGAFRATLNDCQLTDNRAPYGWGGGGGAHSCILIGCVLARNFGFSGGGSQSCILTNCMVTSNSAYNIGGGGYASTHNNCILIGNVANGGGGACMGELNNCVLSGNTANFGGGSAGGILNNCVVANNSAGFAGGAYDGLFKNCIVYYNSAPDSPNWVSDRELPFDMSYSCTTPLPASGTGNLTNTPLFVDFTSGDFHLESNSPCINAGNNGYVRISTDLDGNPRTKGGTVDIGAYEFQNPSSAVSYVWLQQYGLPTDGTADFADGDNDGMNNWQEWIAGTVPTNGLSALRMLALSNDLSGIAVTWESVSGKIYSLQRGTSLVLPLGLTPLQSNIVGQAGLTSFTDTAATNASLYFYRVGVQ